MDKQELINQSQAVALQRHQSKLRIEREQKQLAEYDQQLNDLLVTIGTLERIEQAAIGQDADESL